MVIIAEKIINEFAKKYPLSAFAMNKWYKQVINADWKDFHEVRKTFNSTDSIGNDRYVFDIGGNKYRLVGMIHFTKRTIYIRFIGTHAQYEQICKSGLITKI